MQIQENQLEFEPRNQIIFLSNNQSAVGTLKLKNTTNKIVYFYIVTTLYPDVNINPKIDNLKPNQSKTIEFSLLFNKNITYQHQFISITYQTNQFLKNYVASQSAKSITFQAVLNIKKIIYSNINLREQSIKLKQQGNKYFEQHQYGEALLKYLDAIVNSIFKQELYKYDSQYFINLSSAYKKLSNFEQALLIIEIILLKDPKNIRTKINKGKIYAQIAKHQTNIGHVVKIMKLAKNILKQALKEDKLIQDILQTVSKIDDFERSLPNYEYFEIIDYLEQKINIKNQTEFQKLKFKNIFHNFEQFNAFTKKAFKQIKQEAPQYILDPLNYEIYKNPLIVPSGVSYQQKSLNDCIRYNGPYDPITKFPLNRNFIFHNLTLKQFIKNNKKLSNWHGYEQKIINNNINSIEF